MSEYNGWANYETWRVNLEMVDGMTLEDFGFDLYEVDTDDAIGAEKLASAIETLVYTSETIEQARDSPRVSHSVSSLGLIGWRLPNT